MGKKREEKKAKPKDDFSLEEVLNLGGQKKDYELLQDLDDDEDVEAIDAKEDLDAEPIKKDEIESFIQELGFSKIMQQVEEDDEEKEDEDSKQVKKEPKKKASATGLAKDKPAKDEPKKPKSKNKFKLQHDEISSTTEGSSAKSSQPSLVDLPYQPRNYLLFKPGGKWFNQKFPKDPTKFEPLASDKTDQLDSLATRILEDEVALYRKQQEKGKRSGQAWLRTVLASGTVNDKVAALTVQVQESSIHNLSSLDTLLSMVKKKGKREALFALGTVKDLFLSDLLLPSKKLKTFDQHPLGQLEALASGNKESLYKRLLIWHYEAQIKDRYAQFVKSVEGLVHDQLPAAKKKALGVVFELLAANPEQEKMLLTLLVNKLGDPDYKVASRAAHLLGRTVERHPNMKTVMVLEVERLLYRPHISAKAQYYGVCFLNQLLLTQQDRTLAAKLINIYFSFFKSYVKKGEVDSKMLSALLTGVNRAYPFAKVDRATIEEQMNTLYKIVHIVNFNTSVQALMLLYQVTDASDSVSDRYYMALYKKLLDPELTHSSKQALFLNLLFKSLKQDIVEKRVKAFLKRLLQVCCHHTPTFVCGALILVSEICKKKADLLRLKKVGEDSDDDDEDEHFTDVKSLSDEEAEPDDDKVSDEEVLMHEGHTTTPSWIHRKNLQGRTTSDIYDPSHRNPLYCQADRECIWELEKLSAHYHPSVALFAQTLLKRGEIDYSGDPLQDFSLIRFLDRFVYRNPKKKEKAGSESVKILQAKHRHLTTQGVRSLPVNSTEYLQLKEDRIPVDEKFFHRYFSQQAARLGGKAIEDHDSDAESVEDDEFDQFLDTYETGFIDGGEDIEFDFAGEFSKRQGKKSKKSAALVDEDDSEDDDLSDEEVDFDDDVDFGGDFEMAESDESEEEMEGPDGEFDEEEVAFSEEDDLEQVLPSTSQGRQKKRKDSPGPSTGGVSKKQKRSKEATQTGLFAAAEEFSNMMDETAGSKLDSITAEALSNRDNASAKQLKWELQRDQRNKGKDWRARKGKTGSKGNWKQKSGKKNPRSRQR